ncbi:MAG: site-specific integrase [Lactobacillus sp.]|jgi:integrase|nr:site-specific integrase [Lactobacillus sp.]MCH3989896.1 site-specific integrase [Lactobacillus sp.]MCH4067938.1 site-specific integrase [Lactobacillus sp.]MCI1303623.1 site-specific integrase [Lactobacillus sp.]MCI1329868.1 site-specific integrase [Lactobacillus sp.]
MAVYKRGNYWYARLYWRKPDGTRQTVSEGHFKTKKEASMWCGDMKTKLSNGFQIKEDPVFASYFWDWYQTYKEPHLRVGSKKRYETNHKLLEKYWGHTKIKTIKRLDWQKFINHAGKTRAKQTVELLNRQCRACVRNAVADGIIPRDFTYGVQISGSTAHTRIDKVQMPSAEQIKKLLNYTIEKCSQPKVVSPYVIATLIMTGGRIGEVLALRWSDLNELESTIQFHRSYDSDKRIFGPTKNKSSYRTIKVNKDLLSLLSHLRHNGSDLVFVSHDGTGLPVTKHSVNIALHRYMQACKIPDKYFTAHSLRHCHVALLRHYGMDWYEISQRLGHENLATTLKTYAYMIEEEKRKNNKQVESILDSLTL